MTRRNERGSAAWSVVVAMVMVMGMLAAVERIGSAMIDHARADAVADSVALATAGSGVDVGMAHRIAEANGASVIATSTAPDGTVTVEISYRGTRSTAAARADDTIRL